MTINWGRRPTILCGRTKCVSFNKSIECKSYVVKGTKNGFIATKGAAAFEGGRQVWTLPRHLEGANKRSLGVTGCQRLQNTFCLTAQSGHDPNTTSVSSRAGSSSEGGIPVTAEEESRSPCVRQLGRILLEPLPGTQEKWSNETSDQPNTVEPMGVCRALQNGGNPYPEGSSESRGLVCEGEPEGCILHSSHRSQPPPIPEAHAGQGEIPVHMPPFGLSCAPCTFTKVMKPVIILLRSWGVRIIIYIDDMLILAETSEQAYQHIKTLLWILQFLGFVVNQEKSEEVGTNVSTAKNIFSVQSILEYV